MIVRINQFDVHRAERHGGWPEDGLAGAIQPPWPDDAMAFELLILPNDEQNQPLPRTFRQAQLRQLIPDIIGAMQQETDDTTVARLDGPLAAGEMVEVYKYLTDASGYGRYCISAVEKFVDEPHSPLASVRLHAQIPARLAAMCADPNVGLDRSVRLRVFSLPEPLVNPLLDITDPADERWHEILPHCSFMLSNTRAMQSLQLITRRFTADETRQRLTQRLVGGTKV